MNILWFFVCAYLIRISSSGVIVNINGNGFDDIVKSKNISDCFTQNRDKPRTKILDCLNFCGHDIQCDSSEKRGARFAPTVSS